MSERDGIGPDGLTDQQAGRVRHVEMYDGQTFCGNGDAHVPQDDWHRDPLAIDGANCLRCLRALALLGDRANAAQHRALGNGETTATQDRSVLSEQEEQERRRRDRGETSMTLASFDGILKQAYEAHE